MNQDKKQTKQFIVLGVLAISFMGFVSFQMMGASSTTTTAKPKQQQASVTQESATEENVASENKNIAATLPPGVFPDLSVPLARRDPFLPERTGGVQVNNITPQIHVTPVSRPRPRQINTARVPNFSSMNMGSLPSFSLKPVNPFKNSAGEMTMNAESNKDKEKSDEPSLTLTGTIRGDGDVAIIRDGQSGRHVVKEGETINGQYKVLQITNDGVVVAGKNRIIRVKLGGDKDAS